MFGSWYRIFGVSERMFEKMKGSFDDGIIAFKEEDGIIHISKHMNIFEAWRMRRQIKQWNKENEHKLYLVRV